MKKSNKKIPKTHLPKFDRGGSSRASSDTTRTMYSGSEEAVTGNTQGSGGGINSAYNEGRQSKISGNQYAQMGQAVAQGGMQAYQTSQTPGLSEYEKNQQYGNSIKSAETGVVSAINPIFGMIHAGVTAATAPVTAAATQTDAQGNLKNKNFAKADIIGQGFADPMAMIPTMISNKFSMKKYINSIEDSAKGKIAAQKAQEAAYNQQQAIYQQQQNDFINNSIQSAMAEYQNQPQGSYIQYSNGGMNMQPNAEIESEENVVAPNGGFLQANGPTHEQGGVPVALPGNSMIFSDRLKLGKKTFAELNKVNNTNKEDKVLDSNKYGTTSKRTAELMKFAKNKNSEELFNAQEALKQAKVEAYAKKMGVALPQAQEAPEEGMQFPMGGVKLPMYPLGGPTDNTKFTPAQRQQAYADSMTLYKSGFNKNIPNWQAEPGFNDAVGRLHTLNGVVPQSTDKSATAYANDPNYLAKRSVPYAKPTRPVYEVKTEGKNAFVPTYPNYNMPMKGLERPDDFNPQLQTVPANRPSTIKTNIVTGPTMSYKEYKQGNEVLDRAYFDPSTKKEIEIQGFKYGGKKLPKYTNAGLTPDKEFLKTKFMGAEQNQRNLAFNKMTNSKPLTYSSVPDNNGSTLDQKLYDEELARMNGSNPESTDDTKTSNFDWKGLGSNVAMGLANNAGNIYNLSRYNKPEVEAYQRMQATYLDPSAAMRDANEQTRRAEYNVRGASAGNAGTYLSNRVALNTQNIENKDRIRQQYANANASIANSTAQYNNELARQEVIANAQNRARTRSGKGEAISQIGKNYNQQVLDTKKGKMEESMMQMLPKLVNDPSFMKFYEEYKKNNPND